MSDTLRAFAETNLRAAQKLVRQGKELVPVFIFDNGVEGAIVAVPHYDHDRQGAQARMRAILKDKEAERYCFVMEAWFGMPQDTRPGKHEDYRPSKDAKRRECIAVSAQASNGEKVFLFVEIKRGKQGLVQFEEKTNEISIPLGPLLDLFGLETKQ